MQGNSKTASIDTGAGPSNETELLTVKKIGRPHKPNKMTAAERKRKSRENAAVRERENAAKQALEDKMKETEEGQAELREKWRMKKQLQRQQQSKQKKYAVRQKDKARKQKLKTLEQTTSIPTSTERVRKHQQSLKVTCDFIRKKKVSTPLRKSKERLQKTLDGKTREEKVDFLKSVITSQSPGARRQLGMESTTPTTTQTSTSPSQLLKDTYPVKEKERQSEQHRKESYSNYIGIWC